MRKLHGKNRYTDVHVNKFVFDHNIVFDINKTIENLLSLKKIFEQLNITFFPAFGTFLGMYRDGNLIEWDYDSDIVVINEAYDIIKNNVNLMVDEGFVVIRQEKSIMSLKRNNNYTDIYPFYFYDNKYVSPNGQYYIDVENVDVENYLEIFGSKWKIFNNPEKYFTDRYGSDWRIPKENFSALR